MKKARSYLLGTLSYLIFTVIIAVLMWWPFVPFVLTHSGGDMPEDAPVADPITADTYMITPTLPPPVEIPVPAPTKPAPTQAPPPVETPPTPTPTPAPQSYGGVAVGDVVDGTITHYCACDICNERWAAHIDGGWKTTTAAGVWLRDGDSLRVNIAAGNWLPLGAVVEIDGVAHIIADRGSSRFDRVGRLDVFVPEGHAAAQRLGVRNAEVRVVWLP